MPMVVTADGGYVHSSNQTFRRDGWFQAVCGTVTTHEGATRRFGFVPTIVKEPRSRLRDRLVAQCVRPDQLVTFITDGADDLAGITEHMNLTAKYVLAWFHIAMRFTVLANTTATNLTWTPDTDQEPDLEAPSALQPSSGCAMTSAERSGFSGTGTCTDP